MSTLLSLLLHYLFWQRIMRWTFAAGAVLVLAGVIWSHWETDNRMYGLPVLLGSVLMWLFPLLVSSITFRQLISNTRLSLTPSLRRQAAWAWLLLTVLASLWFGLASTFTKYGLTLPAFTSSFAVISLFLLLSQYWLSSRWGAALYWLFIVGASQIWQLPAIRDAIADPGISLLLTGVALSGWGLLFRWLRTARRIMPLPMIFAQINSTQDGPNACAPEGLLKFSFRGTRSAANTLLFGSYDNLSNRLLLQVFLYGAFPLLMTLLLIIPSLSKDKAATTSFSPLALLAMGLYGCFMAGFLGREWLARLRYLWLRLPGNRLALWQQLERLLWKDVGLSLSVAIGYAVAVGVLTDMPIPYGMAFVAISISTLLFHLYVSQYLRVRQRGLAWHMLVMLLAMLILAGAAALAHLQESLWPLAVVIMALLGISWLLRARTRQHFVTVDWCQIRPMQIGRMGAVISGQQ